MVGSNIEKKSWAEYMRQYWLKRTLEMKQSDIEQETRKKSESNKKKMTSIISILW